jgi:hypothetical protein
LVKQVGCFASLLTVEEIAMATTAGNTRQLSAAATVKAERALDKVAAMQEYEAEQIALRARTERLRALRLAREAETAQAKSEQPPAPQATAEPAKKQPAKKKAAPKRADGRSPKRS